MNTVEYSAQNELRAHCALGDALDSTIVELHTIAWRDVYKLDNAFIWLVAYFACFIIIQMS